MQFRQEQEEVDSALCSPASGRAVWEDSLASGCPPGRLCAGQGAIPPDEAEKSGPNFRKPTGVGRMKGVIWHVYRNQEKGMIRQTRQINPSILNTRHRVLKYARVCSTTTSSGTHEGRDMSCLSEQG